MAEPKKTVNFNAFYLLLAIFGIVLLRDAWTNYQEVSPIPYSQFQSLLKENRVTDVVISDDYIRGTLTTPLSDGKKQFITTRVDRELAAELDAMGVKYSRVVESTFFKELLSWLIPIFLFALVWLFLLRRMGRSSGFGGQLMSIGKSKAKVYLETDTKVTFKDVAGVDEAKEELQEIVSFLKDPGHFSRLGARMPKGVLLVGPPGTGKTLLAKAVAGEAGVPFFSISGSEFVEMFVGVGAARVRDLFEQATTKAPCIIFIDELDALGRSRSQGATSHDEKEQTLNQLLVEMDGFDSRSGIVLLGATNRPEILDPALLRAGRFDRQILVDRPDRLGRLAILEVHVRKIKMAPDVNLEQVAALTPGFTGADLANLANEAALCATRRNVDSVEMEDFNVAIERIIAGLEKRNRILSPKEREVVAHHEMGHALMSAALPGGDAVHKVSIIPRGIGSLGYTIQRPTEDRFLMSMEELQNKMAVLMGGRAAERLIYGQISTGAADDIVKATNIAREMVTRFGMDPLLGNVAYDTEPRNFLGTPTPPSRNYSEESARQIDTAVRALVDGSMDVALGILRRNRLILEESAQLLLEKETLSEHELTVFFQRVKTREHQYLAQQRSAS